MNVNLKECIFDDISNVRNNKSQICRNINNNILEYRYEFILMIKPHCLFNKDKQLNKKMLEQFLTVVENHEIRFKRYYIFDNEFCAKYHIMDKQYQTLNKNAKITNYDNFPILNTYSESGKLIGSFEFLDKYPNIDAENLEIMTHINPCKKLGNGLYLMNVDVNQERFWVINPFHPYQLKFYNETPGIFVVFESYSNTDYHLLTDEMIGNYIPANAKNNSLRNYLFKNKNILELNDVNAFLNGFHISPSSLEGSLSIMKYREIFGIGAEKTLLEHKLCYEDKPLMDLYVLMDNPLIEIDCKKERLFDYMETKKPSLDDSINILKRLYTL